jgi:hypothetical protein
MHPRLPAPATSLTTLVCLLVILIVVAPGIASPFHLPAAATGPRSDDTPTATPATALYLPLIASAFVDLPAATPTATATPAPTATPTATPTLPPACPLPAQRDDGVSLTVSPNRNSALEQMVGKVPFTVSMVVSVTGGTPPYTYCWDVEPDGHQDATSADPSFTFSRAGAFNPLIVVIDAQGNGQYIGTPPVASPAGNGGRP